MLMNPFDPGIGFSVPGKPNGNKATGNGINQMPVAFGCVRNYGK